MPRAGLSTPDVVAAGATLADDHGFGNLALGALAERLGVRTPSLYKHIDGLADLQHRIATLAMTELDQRVRDAMHGKSGSAALAAFATAFRDYVVAHPGRYTATVGARFSGPDDPLLRSSGRVLESMEAVLRGYGIGDDAMVHALRTLRCAFHGFATLSAADGFQWSGDADQSFEWMIRFLDRGLGQIAAP
ncbi:TetR/AcrR family transcriptional regulator [Nocardia sp. alder85J]|uniref:TetR/AcrR family transcriptional regulator n=1 Tax=Nocardia sp. alder85J TaxID=2862949 RepID=UPI001CD41652|nr:TetR-like C-terminal domain-containing protein [Nocardia sp. alder85J]MCX4096475.1 TetR-like C-terminal domain-containing protein [Nocardia sp. alder85J]